MFWSRESLWFFNRIFFPLLKLYVFPGWCTFLFFAFFLFKCNNFLEVGMKKRKRNYSVAKIKFLIRKKLTRIFDISHWIYSFGVFKAHSLFTFSYISCLHFNFQRFQCILLAWWQESQNTSHWYVQSPNIQALFLIFDFLAQSVPRICAMYQTNLKFHLQQPLWKGICCIFHISLHFLVYRQKWKKIQMLSVSVKTWYEKI